LIALFVCAFASLLQQARQITRNARTLHDFVGRFGGSARQPLRGREKLAALGHSAKMSLYSGILYPKFFD
jgi:hypothetical protein